MDPTKPREREALAQLGVKVYDLSSSSSGIIGHSLYGDVPAVVRTIGAQLAAPRAEDAGVTAMIDGNKRMTPDTPEPAAANGTPPTLSPVSATPANSAPITASPLPPVTMPQ
jgi:hypothetical protein